MRKVGSGGFSMSELVITISIISVLASVAVSSMQQFLGGGKDVLAAERQERLNQALYQFAQQNFEVLLPSNDVSTSDEVAVLRTLQFRDPDVDRAKVGSPYFDPRYNPVRSSAGSDYRLRWTGRLYELLRPGDTGTGLLMNFDGTDFTTAFVFPPNFQMAGR